jgi:putative transcriptional regulator
MAVVRRALGDTRRNPGRIDRAKFDATTEADIRRYMIEDGENPDAPPSRDLPGYVLPEAVRAKLGMTQAEFAAAIRVPVATLRNWEQGRRHLDPAARSLLLLVWANPRAALRTLNGKQPAIRPRARRRRVAS